MARRRLDIEMARRGIAVSREEAQEAIAAGKVLVSGSVAAKASRLVAAGEPIELLEPPRRYVSRGGEKLEHALDAFGLDVAGLRCLDVGASTGGFTDCLLQRGAERVYAVDVGHGQLHQRVREDPRVDVYERLDARNLSLEHVGGTAVDFACADVSFISLRLVVPAFAPLVIRGAPVVCLVKPQFEAERRQVGKGGVVRDQAVWAEVLERVVAFLADARVGVAAVVPSPLRGTQGNVEFLALCRAGAGATTTATGIARAVETAVSMAGSGRRDGGQ